MSATGSRIDRVRVTAPLGAQASSLRPRLQHALAQWLDAAEAQHHGLPADAIVLVRQVRASWRAVQQAGHAAGHPSLAFPPAPSLSPSPLSAALHSAQHAWPTSGEPVGAACPAVWFGNEAEVLAGLARDALSGSLAQRWWWRQLVGRQVHDEVVQQRWVASPRHVPLALSLLHADQQDTAWLRHMGEACREALLQALASAFPSDAAVLAWVRAGRPGAAPSTPTGPDDAERLARLCATWLHRPQDAAHGASFLARQAPTPDLAPTDSATDPTQGIGIGSQDVASAKDAVHAGPRAAQAPGAASSHAPDTADATARHASGAPAAAGRTGRGFADQAQGGAHGNAGSPSAHGDLAAGDPAQRPWPAPMPSPTSGAPDGQATLAPTSADVPPHIGPTTGTRDLTGPGAAPPSPEDADPARNTALNTSLNHAAPTTADRAKHPTTQAAQRPAPTANADSSHGPHMATAQPRPARPEALWDRAAPRTDTPHAGLFFLLNAAIGLGWYGDFTQPQHQGLAASPWQFLRAAGQALIGPSWRDDPLHAWLTALDPNPLPHTALRPLWPPLRARLSLALGLPRTQAVQLTVRLPGQVRLRPGRVDVHAPLAQLPLAVRMAGLDRDIGWLPAAGMDIRFHFEAGTP